MAAESKNDLPAASTVKTTAAETTAQPPTNQAVTLNTAKSNAPPPLASSIIVDAATNPIGDVKPAAPTVVATKRSEVVQPKGPSFMARMKRRFTVFKEWFHDRRYRMRVYNDDFVREFPPFFVTRMIMEDEGNLDTDEDRGYVEPKTKRITQLGGVPDGMELLDKAVWDEFLPPSRPGPKKPTVPAA
ncbi:hypothetical protein M3Y94_00874200 [Aphelenchoides besseyi]|nr:hypothetical protein M3Y94_00874200 [Aphelenchoides besseyi]KAI6226620.1 hypothetical protein M3Y95_00639900 [Aphelenchoides besseyi]